MHVLGGWHGRLHLLACLLACCAVFLLACCVDCLLQFGCCKVSPVALPCVWVWSGLIGG
jgi:hypothetical protein